MRKFFIFLLFLLKITDSLAQTDTVCLAVMQQYKNRYIVDSTISNFDYAQRYLIEKPLIWHLPAAGVKGEHLSVFVDTNYIKSALLLQNCQQLAQQWYSVSQANYFKMIYQQFPDFEVVDIKNNPINTASFRGKKMIIGIYNDVFYQGFQAPLELLEKIRQYFPAIEPIMMTHMMTSEIPELPLTKTPMFPIIANAQEFCETHFFQNTMSLAPYFLLIDENGKIQNVFIPYEWQTDINVNDATWATVSKIQYGNSDRTFEQLKKLILQIK